jgi:antitoxin component YwqK of YwqJK toxin-antitoxin module
MAKPKKPTIIVEEYEHGRTESEVISPDGVDIIKHGETKTWFKGRLVRSEYYKNNQLDGLQTKYYTSGDIYKTINWIAGVKHGKVCINREDGSRVEYNNFNGEISGAKCTWNANGDLIEEIEYD